MSRNVFSPRSLCAFFLTSLFCAIALSACSGSQSPASSAPAQGMTLPGEKKHVHTAPHGGTLLELGEDVGHFEFVLDAGAGMLTVYSLDGHANEAVRLNDQVLRFGLTLPGVDGKLDVTLTPVANPLTGESVGDTSQFSAPVPELKGKSHFTISLPAREFRGVHIGATTVSFPEGNS